MKILCLVPSITETFIECGINVVGRTRFCIHPAAKIKSITSVGGTKDIDWQKVTELAPDLVILDKEENTLAMAESCPYPYIALHILSINQVAKEFTQLAEKIDNNALRKVALRWQIIADRPAQKWQLEQTIPGLLNLLSQPQLSEIPEIKYIDYMIWQDPWMAIGPNTFIWSTLEKLGFSDYLISREDKYPNLGDEFKPNKNTFYLFSSEPFPFKRYQAELIKKGFHGAIIDGECYSWYGIRSLNFLENQLAIT